MSFGVFVRGSVMGLKEVTRGQYANTVIGVSIERDNGFGGATEEVITIDVPKSEVESAHRQVHSLRGQIVELPVWVKSWVSKRGNSGISFILSKGATMRPVSPQVAPDHKKTGS